MRKKIAVAVAGGALVLSGVVLAGPALAQTTTPAPPTSESAPAEPGTERVDRITEALAGLVTDGTITQEQADKVATTLAAADPGRGGHGGPGKGLAAAATAIGVTEDELRTALEGGQTLAQVAESKGVTRDTLITALVDAEKARIGQSVTDGRIMQAQADERLADVTERVTERVDSTRPAGGGHGHGGQGQGG